MNYIRSIVRTQLVVLSIDIEKCGFVNAIRNSPDCCPWKLAMQLSRRPKKGFALGGAR